MVWSHPLRRRGLVGWCLPPRLRDSFRWGVIVSNNGRRARDPRYRAGRQGAAYERAKAAVYDTETHCHAKVCLSPTGRLVDKTRPHVNPATGRVDPWSKTFGHTTELDHANSNPLDGHLEHYRCNAAAGAAYGNKKRAGTLSRFDDSLGR